MGSETGNEGFGMRAPKG